ncbi:MAG: translation initiation factor IF-2 [Phycisphaerae bacterium]
MSKRVFELARELGVTSKAVLDKCRAEGLDIKNHMSALSAGLEATVREWFVNPGGGTAVEVAEHVDLEKERKKAQKQQRRRKKSKTEEAEEQTGEEAAAEQQPEEGEEQAATAAVAEAPPAEAEQPTAEAEQPTEAAEAEEKEEAEEPEVEEPKPEQPPEAGKVEEEAEKAQKQPEEEPAEGEKEQEEEKEEKPVGPAGPQVVPRPVKLKGPRVVRVERPEAVERPPRSRGGPRRGGCGGAPATAGTEAPPAPARKGKGGETEEKESRRSKRRSPRRRGRSADSGEKIREWRDQDLAERSERLAAAMGGGLRRHRASVRRGGQESGPSVRQGKVEVEEPITIKNLSAATGIKSGDIIRRLMSEGVLATVNQVISADQAHAIAADYDIELEVKGGETAEDRLKERFEQRKEGKTPRAPVVTMLGHVDHGKTSLLDYIRHTAVAAGEAGGITQHMGAYRLDQGESHVVFLDTPGHEAFTAMRARGANMTDVVVLVVAADDGVMPQTIEAINHARAAGVPIVVALNKMDVPNANEQRALGQLAEHGLQPQEWGGEVEVIRTSAETGQGIDNLVETLSLEAELLELKAEPDGPATGFVIESEMDPGLGVVARLLVRDGTLRQGDVVLAGSSYGRARQIRDDRGREISQAGPSSPVEISGLDEVPVAGDRFYVLEDIDEAREIAEQRRDRTRQKQLRGSRGQSLQDLLSQIEAGESTQLPLIVKADVQGSIEALVGQLEKLGTDEVSVNILHRAVGGITTSDVTLAEASGALIIGFNVVADADARQLAEAKGIDIRTYRVIYDITEDIRKALEEGLAPEVREETVGRAEVRQTFKVSRLGTIAGCRVSDGVAARNAKVRVVRDNVVIADERNVESLKHYKEDAREVRSGMECGVKVAGFDDIQEGDVLEFYRQVEVSRTL